MRTVYQRISTASVQGCIGLFLVGRNNVPSDSSPQSWFEQAPTREAEKERKRGKTVTVQYVGGPR